ncbi:Proteoglycan 4 [Rhizoctonia solani]|uniref:Proteoglycan 4 n=1 Tax=Rhizoctonia solani TaxID=456999 RepID=A0A0K6FTH7_9AGAM|nr:Proteoglycan 4 [Rhizoctonia solani]
MRSSTGPAHASAASARKHRLDAMDTSRAATARSEAPCVAMLGPRSALRIHSPPSTRSSNHSNRRRSLLQPSAGRLFRLARSSRVRIRSTGGGPLSPKGTNAPTAHPSGPVLSCKTCQARNTPCDGVTPVCGSCRIRRLECYLATPASSHPDRRNGNSTSMTWSARDRQALNPRSFPPSLSQAAMLLPPSRPRAPSDASKPSASRSSLLFMLNPKPEGKLASGSKPPAQRPTGLKPITTATTPTHHVTPPTPVAPASMEKAQAAMDVDPSTSPGSSSAGASLSRRPSRKRSASPESHYGREREDSPGRESVSSLGLSALAMNERRNRALSHVHSPQSSIDSHPGRHALEPHSPRTHLARNSIDSNARSSARNSIDSHPSQSARGSMDSHSPTRSTRNSLDLHSRGQPLDEAHSARGLNPGDPHSNRLIDPHSNSRPIDPHSQSHPHPHPHSHRPVDPHPTRPAEIHHANRPMDTRPIDAHRRSIDQPTSLASPIDPNRPRSRSKSSLSHLLDGGGFGGISSPKSPVHATSPTHPRPTDTIKPTSPVHTTPPHTASVTPPHTARPPRTPLTEFGPGPSPTTTTHPGPSPKTHGHSPTASRAFGPGPSPTAYGPGPGPSPTAKTFGPGPSPTNPFSPQSHGPTKSPTATSSSEPFSRPVSAESFTRPLSRDQPVHKASISTALADMNLKSAGTSRASSPGGHGRDVFVHSAFNGANPPNPRPYPWTFGAAGENIKAEGRMANVWRHETEAGMRRREAEAELRKQDQVELQRRRSEGAKRRKLGEEDVDQERRGSSTADERRMSIVSEERRMSIVEPEMRESERRMSIVEPEKRVEPERRVVEPERRPVEPEKRMSGIEMTIPESERQMSIVEQLRKATGVAAKEAGRVINSNSLPNPRPTTDVFNRSRRESAPMPMPARWTDDKSKSPIVINDSPEVGIGDAEMDLPEPTEKLFPERVKAPEPDSASQSTPLAPFGHIWPPPVINDPGKKGRRPKELEPVPARSFITPLNLPPTPAMTHVKQPTPVVDDEPKDKDKEAGPSQLSVLRSMLTTMPPPTAFGTALQEFVSTPATKARRNRAIVMTKTLMKDALGVLLDPQTDELLKDYVPPEKKKEDEKPDGTRRKMSVAIDSADHTSLEFRAWVKRMFSTIKTNQDKDVLAFDGKPVVVEDDIYTTIMICHSQGNHCSIDETAKLVDQEHSWVPRALIEAFVQKCPGCPLENKITSTTNKPRKRKPPVRGAGAGAGAKRKSTMAARRGKKHDGSESARRSRKASGKEASPDESDGEDGDQEEDELKESGDEAGPADVKTDPDPEPVGDDPDQDQDPDQDPDELEPEDELDDAEEPEVESEDEHVSRPSSEGRKNGA